MNEFERDLVKKCKDAKVTPQKVLIDYPFDTTNIDINVRKVRGCGESTILDIKYCIMNYYYKNYTQEQKDDFWNNRVKIAGK